MEQLSKLELLRLLEIIEEGMVICENDYECVTGNYDELLQEAEDMVRKALKTK